MVFTCENPKRCSKCREFGHGRWECCAINLAPTDDDKKQGNDANGRNDYEGTNKDMDAAETEPGRVDADPQRDCGDCIQPPDHAAQDNSPKTTSTDREETELKEGHDDKRAANEDKRGRTQNEVQPRPRNDDLVTRRNQENKSNQIKAWRRR